MQDTITVEIHLTPDIAAALQTRERSDLTAEERLKLPLAIGLFAERTISLAKAARLAGLSRYEFALLLKQKGLPAYEYTQADYQDDLAFMAAAD